MNEGKAATLNQGFPLCELTCSGLRQHHHDRWEVVLPSGCTSGDQMSVGSRPLSVLWGEKHKRLTETGKKKAFA